MSSCGTMRCFWMRHTSGVGSVRAGLRLTAAKPGRAASRTSSRKSIREGRDGGIVSKSSEIVAATTSRVALATN